MNFDWQLINDSITESDKKALTDFINEPNQRFTNGPKVKEFEKKWSDWLGVKHTLREGLKKTIEWYKENK